MSASWPPNPRDAKHRSYQGERAWNTIPVTILLMAISLVTCFFTRVGEESEKADFLFFRSQEPIRQLRVEWMALHDQWSELDLESEDPATVAKVRDAAGQLNRQARLNEAEMREFQTLSWALGDIRSGQVWRLFTPMFLHFGYLHIVFNLWWLWSLGARIEIRYKPWRYALLVLGVAALSNVAQAWLGGTSFGGLSGVNYGLFGFLFLHMRYHPTPSFHLDRQTVVFMLVWLVVCFTGAFGPIANWAHMAGFLTGATVGFTQAMLAGGANRLRRRGEFRRAMSHAQSQALHRCAACGITELDDRDAEFRVGNDGEEYCHKHLAEGD